MGKNLLLSVFLLFLSSICTFAQQRTVSGRVTASADGSPLPGVNVVIKGTATGTATDADGRFTLTVGNSGDVLIFSFIGFINKEVTVGQQSTVDVSLDEDATQLSEVVVTGYGVTPKRELTGAVSSVRGEALRNMPVQSFDRALQGQAAGVQVLSANGVPGGAVNVRIRGLGSITAGNEPLYIVDGVQLNNRNDGGGTVSNNPLAFLNPNDIESIDVLKDAANASIYGSQAANGVVIITTKKGKSGQKTRFDLNYYKGFVEPMPTLRMLNTQELFQVRKEARLTANPSLTEDQVRQAVLADFGFPTTLTEQDIAALPTYDWQKESFKTGTIDNLELSMSGGNDATTFYASMAYNGQDASLINIDFKRLGGKLNLTHKINSKVSTEIGLNVSSITQRGPYGDARGTTAFGAPQYASPLILPFNPIYDPSESSGFFGLPASGDVIVGDLSQNVIANANYIKSKGLTNQFVGNLAVNYKIIDGLTFRVFGGLDYRNLRSEFYGDPRLSDYFNIKGTQTTGNNVNSNLQGNATLTYNKTFAAVHNASALVGFEYREEINEGNSFTGRSFPTPDFSTPNAAAIPFAVGGFWTGFKRAGFFGNFKYDYNKKYILSVTMRYDGSSRFGSDSQYGFFPSISGAWNLTEENFMKGAEFVSDLRLRAGIGTTGNDQIGNFDSRSLYGLGGVYGGVTGIGPSQMGNADLRWERNQTTNIGVDYGFFGNRISGSVEVFQRLSKDLLLAQSLPQTSGFNSITKNVGEVKNEGLEFELRTINLDRNGFKWTSNFNITFLRNEVVSLFDGLQVLPGNLAIRVGYPLGTNINNPYAGVNPANGRPMHYDINGNLTYLRVAADQVPMGHQNFSDMFGGFTNTLTYKGIEFSFFFQYDYGRTVANVQHFRMADLGGVPRNSRYSFFEERWTTPGQITSVPRPALNRTEIASTISSYQTTARFYEDASFIRLKQVTLAYNLPQNILGRLKISNARIYAQAINLITWTKWTGYDPEFQDTGNGTEGIIPQTRNYTFGIQVGF
ncbi:MAG: TonB-dependent receptor [Cyclobacteriaceae bacterium]|nr:TonB-dependent receptor [Cyclobacteriaceae bacterium]